MPVTVNLTSELRGWIIHNLDRGCPPTDLIDGMISQRFERARRPYGAALRFPHSLESHRRQQLDARSLHAGAPVIEGEKWAVTKWMRTWPYC